MIDFSEERYRAPLALLLELGCVCALSGSSRSAAQTLIAAHQAARPGGRGALLGEALVALCCDGKPQEAVAVLRRSGIDYRDAGEEPQVVALFGFILMQAGHKSEAATIAQHLLDHSADAGALKTARGIQSELASSR